MFCAGLDVSMARDRCFSSAEKCTVSYAGLDDEPLEVELDVERLHFDDSGQSEPEKGTPCRHSSCDEVEPAHPLRAGDYHDDDGDSHGASDSVGVAGAEYTPAAVVKICISDLEALYDAGPRVASFIKAVFESRPDDASDYWQWKKAQQGFIDSSQGRAGTALHRVTARFV